MEPSDKRFLILAGVVGSATAGIWYCLPSLGESLEHAGNLLVGLGAIWAAVRVPASIEHASETRAAERMAELRIEKRLELAAHSLAAVRHLKGTWKQLLLDQLARSRHRQAARPKSLFDAFGAATSEFDRSAKELLAWMPDPQTDGAYNHLQILLSSVAYQLIESVENTKLVLPEPVQKVIDEMPDALNIANMNHHEEEYFAPVEVALLRMLKDAQGKVPGPPA